MKEINKSLKYKITKSKTNKNKQKRPIRTIPTKKAPPYKKAPPFRYMFEQRGGAFLSGIGLIYESRNEVRHYFGRLS